MSGLRAKQVLERFGSRSLGRSSSNSAPSCLLHLCKWPGPPISISTPVYPKPWYWPWDVWRSVLNYASYLLHTLGWGTSTSRWRQLITPRAHNLMRRQCRSWEAIVRNMHLDPFPHLEVGRKAQQPQKRLETCRLL